jgi:Cytochrome c oxidase caa3 assembly factor (Caa3_CtaG)
MGRHFCLIYFWHVVFTRMAVPKKNRRRGQSLPADLLCARFKRPRLRAVISARRPRFLPAHRPHGAARVAHDAGAATDPACQSRCRLDVGPEWELAIAGRQSSDPSLSDTAHARCLELDARRLEHLRRQPVVWHYPTIYDAALRVPWLHDIEHILFFLSALVFWWPVIRPVSRPAPVQDAIRIFYLFLAATQDALLSGMIALSGEILYPHYETALRLWDLTPQEDQIGGGIVMFGVSSMTYLVAILVLVNALLGEGRHQRSTKRALGDGAEKIEGRI